VLLEFIFLASCLLLALYLSLAYPYSAASVGAGHLTLARSLISFYDGFFCRHFAKLCYTVIALDELGVGQSDSPDGYSLNIADHVLSLNQILE
jgi:hypothetical protein